MNLKQIAVEANRIAMIYADAERAEAILTLVQSAVDAQRQRDAGIARERACACPCGHDRCREARGIAEAIEAGEGEK